MQKVLDGVVSLRTIQIWYREFKMGRPSFEDEPRTGRPNTEVTNEIIEAVGWEVVENPELTCS